MKLYKGALVKIIQVDYMVIDLLALQLTVFNSVTSLCLICALYI